ncbi:MAG: hypothetical protein HQ567_15530 [Candidatus Nealsonbacteria bacterium]|nr:hypothetical protein [Candidatus Nealsonbacteria bacterium]
MLHAEHPVVALRVDMLEDVDVVDFARARLFSSRIIADVERANLFPRSVDIRNQIALGDLLVIEVVDDLDRWAVDGAADQVPPAR